MKHDTIITLIILYIYTPNFDKIHQNDEYF